MKEKFTYADHVVRDSQGIPAHHKIAKLRKKILAELDATNFAGWRGNNEFLKMDWNTFQHWCAGQIMIGIGRGGQGFENAVHNCLRYAMAWEQYHTRKVELERKFGIDNLPSWC